MTTYRVEKQVWDREGLGLECDHPLCHIFHKNRECPTPGGRYLISWVIVDENGHRANEPFSANFDTKKEALDLLRRYNEGYFIPHT
jgi:hypothetical protein